MLAAINRMNDDLGCLENYYIPYDEYDKDNPQYENGIMIVWGSYHDGTSGCWSTTGIAPGFTAGSGSIYRTVYDHKVQ